MAKIPEPRHTLVALVDRAVEQAQDDRPRPHMGASMLGHECERYLWLSFRWAFKPRFKGRMLRLFERGHREELSIVKWLKMAGLATGYTELDGNQKRVELGGHVSGSMDGIIYYGVPEAPAKKHVLEIKTHNDKSFKQLCKLGVEGAKYQHFIQTQVYMYGEEIDRALYVAVNKNDDSLYTERVRLNKTLAKKYIAKGKRISVMQEPPERISNDKTFFKCKWCEASDVCHSNKTTEVNCRTCGLFVPKDDGTWYCNHWGEVIPTEWQYDGCPDHVLHPDMVPWSLVDSSGSNATFLIDGKEVTNGHNGFSSAELLANPESCAHSDKFTETLRRDFKARVVD